MLLVEDGHEGNLREALEELGLFGNRAGQKHVEHHRKDVWVPKVVVVDGTELRHDEEVEEGVIQLRGLLGVHKVNEDAP